MFCGQGTFTSYTTNNLGGVTWNSTGCTDVVINFGQWLAAAELARPESVHTYVTKLRDVIAHLQRLRAAGARIYWLTTNSFPLWRGAWWVPRSSMEVVSWVQTCDGGPGCYGQLLIMEFPGMKGPHRGGPCASHAASHA